MEYDVVPNPNKRPARANKNQKKMSLDSDEEEEEEYSEYNDDDDEDFEWFSHDLCTFKFLVFSQWVLKSSENSQVKQINYSKNE